MYSKFKIFNYSIKLFVLFLSFLYFKNNYIKLSIEYNKKPLNVNEYKIFKIEKIGFGNKRRSNLYIKYNEKLYKVTISYYEDCEDFIYINKNELNKIFYYSEYDDEIFHRSEFSLIKGLMFVIIILNILIFTPLGLKLINWIDSGFGLIWLVNLINKKFPAPSSAKCPHFAVNKRKNQ
jgi:hypothetical protein